MVYIPSLCDASALFCHAAVYNLFSLENFSNSFDKNTVSSSFVAVCDNSCFSGAFEIFVASVMLYATGYESSSCQCLVAD